MSQTPVSKIKPDTSHKSTATATHDAPTNTILAPDRASTSKIVPVSEPDSMSTTGLHADGQVVVIGDHGGGNLGDPGGGNMGDHGGGNLIVQMT